MEANENRTALETRFSEIYAAHANALLRFCWFRLFNRGEAKDAIQEVFLRYWRYLVAGEDVKNDRALLYKIARNLVIDTNARRVPQSLDELVDQGFEPADDSCGRMVDFLDGLRAMKSLETLDDASREALTMRFVQGLSSREIGEITGDSEGAVNVRVHRALKKLRGLCQPPNPKELGS